MNLLKHKSIYFIISAVIIIPGLLSLLFWGVHLSIDFIGGSLFEIRFEKPVTSQEIKQSVSKTGVDVETIALSGTNSYIIRTKPIDKDKNEQIKTQLTNSLGKNEELRFETVGPTIGQEVAVDALKALVLASALIVLYIAFAFRQVPKPYSSWRFGLSAIAALLHDVLLLVGVFSLLGHFLNVELDSLFVTALLTVIGFSVHDTIVVFDRIRENLRRMPNASFEQVANDSLVQTLNRSLNTSLTVVFVLLALLLFGGETIHWFVVALLVGIVSGTYSSIFNATPILVVWEAFAQKKRKK